MRGWPGRETWAPVDLDRAKRILAELAERDRISFFDECVVSAESTRPSFYTEHEVVRIEAVWAPNGVAEPRADRVIDEIFVLCGTNGASWLNGDSSPIHKANDNEGLALADAHAEDYLRFFLYFLRAGDNSFALVEPESIPQPDGDLEHERTRELLVGHARTPTRGPDEDGRAMFDATVLSGGGLYEVRFAVGPTGEVEMIYDVAVEEVNHPGLSGYSALKPVPRTLRASLIREWVLNPAGQPKICIPGAKILGKLDLEFVTLAVPLILEDCEILGEDGLLAQAGKREAVAVDLSRATGSWIQFRNCRLRGAILADHVHTTLGLDLSDSTVEGSVSLRNARIDGSLTMTGIRLERSSEEDETNPWSPALLKIDDATIGSNLDLQGARLVNGPQTRSAIDARRITVGGATLFDNAVVGARAAVGPLSKHNVDADNDDDPNVDQHDDGKAPIVVLLDLLDLTGARLRHGLSLYRATIDGSINLREAEVDDNLDMRETHLRGGLDALGIKIRGNAFLESVTANGSLNWFGANVVGTFHLYNSTIHGVLNIENAEIASNVILRGTHILNNHATQYGLESRGIKVGGGISMRPIDETESVDGNIWRFTCKGSIDARDATIGNELILDGISVDGGTLDLKYSTVGGPLAMTAATTGGLDLNAAGFGAIKLDRATIAGAVSLQNTRVALDLTLDGTSITGAIASTYEGQEDQFSLVADGLEVGGNISFVAQESRAFSAVGALDLRRITVGGSLRFVDATVGEFVVLDDARIGASLVVSGKRLASGRCRPDAEGAKQFHDSLIAKRIHVGGDISFHRIHATDRAFQSAHGVILRGAKIGGQLDLRGRPEIPYLDLRDAQCAQLQMPESKSPSPLEVRLQGFAFETLDDSCTLEDGREWARRQGWTHWTPDAYEQLGEFYRRSGHDGDSRRIGHDKHKDELDRMRRLHDRGSTGASVGSVTPSKPTDRARAAWRRPFAVRPQEWPRYATRGLFGILLGFGYYRYRAVLVMVALIAITWLSFWRFDSTGVMVSNYQATHVAAATTATQPPTNQPVTCGEAYPCFNPIAYAVDVVLPVVDLGQDSAWYPDRHHPDGALAEWVRWLAILLGWTMATVIAAAVAGLIKHD